MNFIFFMNKYSRNKGIFITIWDIAIFKKKGKIKMKICCFAGHARLPNKEELKIKLKKEITNLIENEKVTTFYSGGKGAFDYGS